MNKLLQSGQVNGVIIGVKKSNLRVYRISTKTLDPICNHSYSSEFTESIDKSGITSSRAECLMCLYESETKKPKETESQRKMFDLIKSGMSHIIAAPEDEFNRNTKKFKKEAVQPIPFMGVDKDTLALIFSKIGRLEAGRFLYALITQPDFADMIDSWEMELLRRSVEGAIGIGAFTLEMTEVIKKNGGYRLNIFNKIERVVLLKNEIPTNYKFPDSIKHIYFTYPSDPVLLMLNQMKSDVIFTLESHLPPPDMRGVVEIIIYRFGWKNDSTDILFTDNRKIIDIYSSDKNKISLDKKITRGAYNTISKSKLGFQYFGNRLESFDLLFRYFMDAFHTFTIRSPIFSIDYDGLRIKDEGEDHNLEELEITKNLNVVKSEFLLDSHFSEYLTYVLYGYMSILDIEPFINGKKKLNLKYNVIDKIARKSKNLKSISYYEAEIDSNRPPYEPVYYAPGTLRLLQGKSLSYKKKSTVFMDPKDSNPEGVSVYTYLFHKLFNMYNMNKARFDIYSDEDAKYISSLGLEQGYIVSFHKGISYWYAECTRKSHFKKN